MEKTSDREAGNQTERVGGWPHHCVDAQAAEHLGVVSRGKGHLPVLLVRVARPERALEGQKLRTHRVHVPCQRVVQRLVPENTAKGGVRVRQFVCGGARAIA